VTRPADFLDPFVQTMLQQNQDQPALVGLAIGIQVNLSLIKTTVNRIEQDRFAVLVNLQEPVSVSMRNGRCSAASSHGLHTLNLGS
jgi:hypothetical protein